MCSFVIGAVDLCVVPFWGHAEARHGWGDSTAANLGADAFPIMWSTTTAH